MAESTYPKPVDEILATLVEIFQHQKKPEIVELLSNAHGRYDAVDHDGWNGGITIWALRLEVPLLASFWELETSSLHRLIRSSRPTR